MHVILTTTRATNIAEIWNFSQNFAKTLSRYPHFLFDHYFMIDILTCVALSIKLMQWSVQVFQISLIYVGKTRNFHQSPAHIENGPVRTWWRLVWSSSLILCECTKRIEKLFVVAKVDIAFHSSFSTFAAIAQLGSSGYERRMTLAFDSKALTGGYR